MEGAISPAPASSVCGICFTSCDTTACEVCGVRAHEDCSQFLSSELPTQNALNPVFRVRLDADLNKHVCGICQTQRKKRAGSSLSSNLFTCDLCFKQGENGCLMPVSGAGRHFAHVCCARFSLQDSSLVTITGARAYAQAEERECSICLQRRGVTTSCVFCIDGSEPVHVFCALKQANSEYVCSSTQPRGLVCKRHQNFPLKPAPPTLAELLGDHFCGVCLLRVDDQASMLQCDGCSVLRHSTCSTNAEAPEYCSLCQRRNSRGEPAKCTMCPHVHSSLASKMNDKTLEYAHEFCSLASEYYPAAAGEEQQQQRRCALCLSSKGHLVASSSKTHVHTICLAMYSEEFKLHLARRMQFDLEARKPAEALTSTGSNARAVASTKPSPSTASFSLLDKIVLDETGAGSAEPAAEAVTMTTMNTSPPALPELKFHTNGAQDTIAILVPDISVGTGFRPHRRSVASSSSFHTSQQHLLTHPEHAFLQDWYVQQQQHIASSSAAAEFSPELQFRLRSAIAGAWQQTNSKPASHHGKPLVSTGATPSSATPSYSTVAKKRRSYAKSMLNDANNATAEYFTRANINLGPLTLDEQPIDMAEAWQILEPYFRRLPNVDDMKQCWQGERQGDALLGSLGQIPMPPTLITCAAAQPDTIALHACPEPPPVGPIARCFPVTAQQLQTFCKHDCVLFNNAYAAVAQANSALWTYTSPTTGEITGLCHAMYFVSSVMMRMSCASEEAVLGLIAVTVPPGSHSVVFLEANGTRHQFRADAKQKLITLAVTGMRFDSRLVCEALPPVVNANEGQNLAERIAAVQRELEETKQSNDDEFQNLWMHNMNTTTQRMQAIKRQIIAVEQPYLSKKRKVVEKIRLHERKLQLERSATCHYCHGEESVEGNPIIICGGADCTFSSHQACLGLDKVPEEEWFCDRCVYKRTGVRPPPRATDRVPLLDTFKDLRGLRSRRSLTLEEKMKETKPAVAAVVEVVAAPPLKRTTPAKPPAAAAAAESTAMTSCMCNSTNYVEGMLMLCCDDCSIWYHPECIHLKICPLGHENCVIYKQKHTMDLSNWRFKCPRCCHQSNPVLQRLNESEGEKQQEVEQQQPAAAEEEEEEATATTPKQTRKYKKRKGW